MGSGGGGCSILAILGNSLVCLNQFGFSIARCTEATFVLVARDPLNRGSAFINPLEVVGEEEEKLFKLGEQNKIRWSGSLLSVSLFLS